MTTKHHRVLLRVLIAFVVLLVIFSAFQGARAVFRPHVSLKLGDGVFSANLARTNEEHIRGLSGVKNLPSTEALLFVFESSDIRSVWMKNMKIPIDVVWLDKDRQVVHMIENLSPDTYPNSYEAKKPSKYIVEFAAGTVGSKAIKIGSKADFDLNQIKGVDW